MLIEEHEPWRCKDASAILGRVDPGLLRSIQILQPILRQQPMLRARLFRRDDPNAGGDLIGKPSDVLVEVVTAVSRSLWKLFEECAPEVGIESMFELFANGELRMELLPDYPAVWTTQPSSANYFCFAELAFMAMHCDVDRVLWETLASVFTRTQRVYTRVYAPSIARPQFDDYRACNFRSGRRFERWELDALRIDYESLPLPSLRWECARNAAVAFAGSPEILQ